MSETSAGDRLRALLAQTRLMVERESTGHGLDGDLDHVLRSLGKCSVPRPPPPRSRPAVDGWLAHACSLADPAATGVAGALLDAAPCMDWYTPYDADTAPPRYQPFIDGYACAMLCGGPRPHGARPAFHAPGLLFAFTIQAPGMHYPPHRHPARELYRVLGGTGRWWRQDEEWAWREPGEWLAHDHFEDHAMKSESQPLLSVAIWLDHLDGSAAFSA